MKFRSKVFFLVLLALPAIAHAALSPVHQNEKDLAVFIAFIQEHEEVIGSLASIDFAGKAVHYGDGCVATFKRKWVPRLPGMVGPAAPLKLNKSSCKLD